LAPLSVAPFSYGLRRIVAQVNQLMSLCDKLEASLLRSQADSERLMVAVVSIVPGDDSKSK